jgi:hypothetical protein
MKNILDKAKELGDKVNESVTSLKMKVKGLHITRQIQPTQFRGVCFVLK